MNKKIALSALGASLGTAALILSLYLSNIWPIVIAFVLPGVISVILFIKRRRDQKGKSVPEQKGTD